MRLAREIWIFPNQKWRHASFLPFVLWKPGMPCIRLYLIAFYPGFSAVDIPQAIIRERFVI